MSEHFDIVSEEDQHPATKGARCRSLRCKGMYINFGLPEDEQVAGDGNFWCDKTQTIFGPDDQLVEDGECSHAGRSCYNTIR